MAAAGWQPASSTSTSLSTPKQESSQTSDLANRLGGFALSESSNEESKQGQNGRATMSGPAVADAWTVSTSTSNEQPAVALDTALSTIKATGGHPHTQQEVAQSEMINEDGKMTYYPSRSLSFFRKKLHTFITLLCSYSKKADRRGGKKLTCVSPAYNDKQHSSNYACLSKKCR